MADDNDSIDLANTLQDLFRLANMSNNSNIESSELQIETIPLSSNNRILNVQLYKCHTKCHT